MDINFTTCRINRLIIHEVFRKQSGQDQAQHAASNSVMVFTSEVEELLKIRLNEAFGRESQSFAVGIENNSTNSFFAKTISCINADDTTFITQTSEMCTALADCIPYQTSGGYLIVLQGQSNNRFFLTAIKADKTQALQTSGNNLQVLSDIFLSPSAKFFKIATISQLPGQNDPALTSSYEALIFDEQFKSGIKLAQYFYKELCGFEVHSNAKIKTREFFQDCMKVIIKNAEFAEQERIKDLLLNEILYKNSLVISPADFARDFLQPPFLDVFQDIILPKYPGTFVKDSILLDRTLSHKNMFFNEIKLTGPTNIFSEAIEIIDTTQELNALHIGTEIPYTVLKIYGKPKLMKPIKSKS